MIKSFKDDFGIYKVSYTRKDDTLMVEIGERKFEISFDRSKAPRYILSMDNRRIVGYAVQHNGKIFLHLDGREKVLEIINEEDNIHQKGAFGGSSELSVVAPMPGTVIKILVAAGQLVKSNQPLAIVEAMKMENEVRAPGEALVNKILVSAGQQVGFGQELMELVPPGTNEENPSVK